MQRNVILHFMCAEASSIPHLFEYGRGLWGASRAVQRYLLKVIENMDLRPPRAAALAVLRDCVGLIEPENIVGEASNSREDARIFSNARCIFA